MSWKSPWSKPTAVDARAQALAEEEAALALQMEEIRQQMEALKNPSPPPPSPPVRRSHKSGEDHPAGVLSSPTKKFTQRTHRAQQKRDRNRFLLLLLLVMVVFLLVFHAIR